MFHFLTWVIKQKESVSNQFWKLQSISPLVEIHGVLWIKFSEKPCAHKSGAQITFSSNLAEFQGPREFRVQIMWRVSVTVTLAFPPPADTKHRH